MPDQRQEALRRLDAKDLRASWDRAQEKKIEDSLQNWHLIGPFPGKKGSRQMLECRDAA